MILALDPGFDELGFAYFRPLPRGVVDPLSIRRAYLRSGHLALAGEAYAIVPRLATLAEAVTDLLSWGGGAARVVIEQPARAGTYRRQLPHQRSQQSVNAEAVSLLYLSIGALVACVLAAGLVPELVSSGKPKLLRLQIIASHWPQFRAKVYTRGGKDHPKGSPKPDDETDAVYLGLQAALTCR